MNIYDIKNLLAQGKNIFEIELRVTFYARVSTDSLEQDNSLQNQILYYENLIKKNEKWIYVDGYVDEGISGKSVEKREAFLNMINDARQNKFDLILTKEISRFARNTIDSLSYTRQLLNYGVGVFFQNDNINTLHADAELRLAILSSIAQDEVRKISERVRFGYKRSIEKGRVLGNNSIWGYTKNDGKLEIIEKEAEIIRLIFKSYSEGKGIRGVSKLLCENKIYNKNGKAFTFGVIKNILTNPKYKGWYCGNKNTKQDYMSEKRIQIDKSKWVTYKDNNNVPPIVSEKLWDECNEILRNRSEKMKSDNKTSYQNKYSYSGKIFCMKHNVTYWRTLYNQQKQPKEVWQCSCYRKMGLDGCSNVFLYKEELDYIVKSQLDEIIENKDMYINDYYEIFKEVYDTNSIRKELKNINSQVDILKKKKNKLLDLSINDIISNQEFKEKNNEYNEQLSKLNELILIYDKKIDNKTDLDNKLTKIKETLRSGYSFDDEAIKNFLDRIEVYQLDNNIVELEINFNLGIERSFIYIRNDTRLLPSIHMIKAEIETEIAPLVGTEKQSEELVNYLMKEFEGEPSQIWQSNLFGKNLHELMSEGLQNKLNRMPDEARLKLQETLQKVINEGSGGLICIIL